MAGDNIARRPGAAKNLKICRDAAVMAGLVPAMQFFVSPLRGATGSSKGAYRCASRNTALTAQAVTRAATSTAFIAASRIAREA
jgi:hypothetical protein